MRFKIALAHATLVVQRSWRRTIFIRERNAASTKIQTQYRLSVARRAYLATRAATIKMQSQWRQYAERKEYLQLSKKIVLLQSHVRRWCYGVVYALRRKAALQLLQNRARRWLAVRTLESMREYRIQVIQNAIRCQVRLLIAIPKIPGFVLPLIIFFFIYSTGSRPKECLLAPMGSRQECGSRDTTKVAFAALDTVY